MHVLISKISTKENIERKHNLRFDIQLIYLMMLVNRMLFDADSLSVSYNVNNQIICNIIFPLSIYYRSIYYSLVYTMYYILDFSQK